MQVKGRGPGKRSDSTKLLNGCAGHLFGDKITVWRIKRMSELCTRRLLDPRRKLRLAIHQAVEVVGVQHQESCGHHGRYSRRTPRAAQSGELLATTPIRLKKFGPNLVARERKATIPEEL
jgi:hypothetical protein